MLTQKAVDYKLLRGKKACSLIGIQRKALFYIQIFCFGATLQKFIVLIGMPAFEILK